MCEQGSRPAPARIRKKDCQYYAARLAWARSKTTCFALCPPHTLVRGAPGRAPQAEAQSSIDGVGARSGFDPGPFFKDAHRRCSQGFGRHLQGIHDRGTELLAVVVEARATTGLRKATWPKNNFGIPFEICVILIGFQWVFIGF